MNTLQYKNIILYCYIDSNNSSPLRVECFDRNTQANKHYSFENYAEMVKSIRLRYNINVGE